MSRYEKPEVCPHCGVELPPRKINMCSRVVDTIRTRPDLTYEEIAEAYHIGKSTVIRYAKRGKVTRGKKSR